MRKLIVVILLILMWQSVYFVFEPDYRLIPSPVEIGRAFFYSLTKGEIVVHILASLRRVLIGFLIASVGGVIIAIFSGYYKRVSAYIHPLIEILRPIPPIAWIPIAILIFGLGDASACFVVAFGAFFPVFSSTYFGITSLPGIYKNVADSFEIKNSVFMRKILFYFSLPYIFAGLKIGIGMAWMSVIAAELIGAQSGLGYFIQLNRLLLRTDNILVGMILIGLIGLILSKSLSWVEKIAIPWKKQ